MANTKTPSPKTKVSKAVNDDVATGNQDEQIVNMPEVTDIPGQENIRNAGIPNEMTDTTIASDDEEGIVNGQDIFDKKDTNEDDDDVQIVMGTEADVTNEDLALLGDADQDMDMNEDELIEKQGLDDTDEDGDPLNEAAVNEDTSGYDLDMPEDEEVDKKKDNRKNLDDEDNDYYSLGSGDNDELKEGRNDD
jgi:hypothetical protein